MIAEIIAVGTELLMGQITNTNAQYLAQRINELGINSYYQQTVGDNMQRIVASIELAMTRSDIIILCGGLGPTQDDLTKWALAEIMGVSMFKDEESVKTIEEFFSKRSFKMTPNNLRQAEFPIGSTPLPNVRGTAPGCHASFKGKDFFILPGPPYELRSMFENAILPILESKIDKKRASKMLGIFGIGESYLEHHLKDLIEKQQNPTIAMYAKPLIITLRITAQTELNQDPNDLLCDTISEIEKRLGDSIYTREDESMEVVVAKLLKEQGKTIAVAESLTGGMICSTLVNVAGISEHLIEGIVCYSNQSKIILGVKADTIEENTAVSEQVALEMASCIRKKTNADIGLSTTGVAGPGEDKNGNKCGKVFIGVSTKDKDFALEIECWGDRNRIRTAATLHSLNQLRLLLRYDRALP